MKIGAHVSTSGGIANAPARAAQIGAETIQIFTSIPQTWRKRSISDAEVEAFRGSLAEHGIGPVFIHAIYLINLATSNPELLEKSVSALITDLEHGSRIGAGGVIFHVGIFQTGSFDDVAPQIIDAIRRILDATPEDTRLLIENAAGERKGVGCQFSEIGALIRGVGSPRLGMCLDTAHAFASCYDVTDRQTLDRMMDELDREVGLERLTAVHANDSKVECGRGVDRHENIGEGKIGRAGFENILAHPAFRDLPLLLEVPGYDGKGPDARNVETLRSLATAVGAA
ncbi:MAG TPA: deoxyribonuclease IV [Dehalococcoidia bacterium]|nr:deoxyribonuclease IV [Dehalococcoidia bacterium]